MEDVVKPVKIVISGKLNYEDEISLSQAAQIIAFIDSSSGVVTGSGFTPPPPKAINALPASSMSSPREALEASGAKTNPEKIVTFALYVGQEGAKENFTLEDIKPLFRRARETPPGNITRDLAAAIKAGWVAESGTKDEYFVTSKAAGALDDGFEAIRGSRSNGARGRSAAAKGIRKTSKSAPSIPEAFAGVEAISSTIEGYIDYHKLSRKRDMFLWAVNAANLLGVTAVSNQDIVWLTDRLGNGIAAADINTYYRDNQKRNYVNRSLQDNKVRMLPAGEEYLRSLAGAQK